MIDKNAPLPLVYQTENFICEIIAERYSVGHLIPTQQELAEILGVSRITVRNAIEALKKRGILYSCRGKGTIVLTLPPPLEKQPAELFDFPMIQPTAIQPALCGSLILDIDFASHTCFPHNTRHLKIERQYFKEKESLTPLAWEECLWNGQLLPNMEGFAPKSDVSLYVQLEEQFSLAVTRCTENIEPRIAADSHCHFFKLPSASPLLCIKRFSYVEGQLFEYRETLIRHEDFGIFVYKANK